METEQRILAAVERRWNDIKFAFWGRFLIDQEYKRCIKAARIEALNLERTGLAPEVVSQQVQQYLRDHCPDLQILVEGNNVFIEKISGETRVYFDWRDSIKAS